MKNILLILESSFWLEFTTNQVSTIVRKLVSLFSKIRPAVCWLMISMTFTVSVQEGRIYKILLFYVLNSPVSQWRTDGWWWMGEFNCWVVGIGLKKEKKKFSLQTLLINSFLLFLLHSKLTISLVRIRSVQVRSHAAVRGDVNSFRETPLHLLPAAPSLLISKCPAATSRLINHWDSWRKPRWEETAGPDWQLSRVSCCGETNGQSKVHVRSDGDTRCTRLLQV